MKKARHLILGLMYFLYVILFGPMAYFGAELWTNILFGESHNISTLALLWSYTFFYCFMALIFVLPGIAILAVKMLMEGDSTELLTIKT